MNQINLVRRVRMSEKHPQRLLVVFGMAILALGNAPRFARADESKAVNALLKSGWGVSISARKESDRLYRETVAAGESTSKLSKAMLLVQMRQRRYPDAMKLAERIVGVNSSNLDGQQARAWLATMTKDYEKALLFYESFAQRIAEAPEAERADKASFLGRMVGYLEAVNPKGVTIEQVRDAAARVERLLGASAATYNEARREVVRKHHTLTTRKDASVAEKEAVAAEVRDRKLSELADRRGRLSERRSELRADQDRLNKEFSEKISEVNSRLAPLNDQAARVGATGQSLNFDLGEIVAEIRYLESLLAHVRDPILRDRYRREILQLDRIASRYEADAYRLEQQAYAIDAARTNVAAEGVVERNRVGAALNRTEKELDDIKKAEKRTRIEEQRARRPDRAATRTSRMMAAQISSLSTYAPFPLEREKLRLLESLK